MVIAVEFDGTIVENNYPEIGKEVPGSLYILKELQNRGNKIILSTNREGDELKAAVNFCLKQNLTFDATFNSSVGKHDNQKRKIRADINIDFQKTGEKSNWMEIFWKLYPDEFYYVRLKKPVKRSTLKKLFRGRGR